MVRTALRANEAAQALFRLIVSFGATGYEAAVLLVQFQFDFTRAALQLGLHTGCRACRVSKSRDSLRGCDRCVALLRQRVHRAQDRMQGLLGERTPTTRHRRPAIRYGASGSAEGRQSLYETTPAVGAEAEEL